MEQKPCKAAEDCPQQKTEPLRCRPHAAVKSLEEEQKQQYQYSKADNPQLDKFLQKQVMRVIRIRRLKGEQRINLIKCTDPDARHPIMTDDIQRRRINRHTVQRGGVVHRNGACNSRPQACRQNKRHQQKQYHSKGNQPLFGKQHEKSCREHQPKHCPTGARCHKTQTNHTEAACII